MSETLNLRAADIYGSLLRDVTPSKVHRLEQATSPRNRLICFYDSIMLKAAIQQEWDKLSATQLIEGSTSSTSESDEDLRRTAFWVSYKTHFPKAPQFTRQPISIEGTLGPSEHTRQTARARETKHWTPRWLISSLAGQILSQHLSDTDLSVSNLAGISQRPEQETELTPDEKRHHELTEKYFNGTLTQEEQLDLAQLQKALDEADAKDPQLMKLNQNLTAGYDRLQTGLRQVNKILDELLDTVSHEEKTA